MLIKYIQKTTLIDFPKHIASTIFVGGCNFKCPYCYNSELVHNYDKIPTILRKDVLTLLKNRAHLIEGVAITGGEPLNHPDLADFLREIRNLNLKIKLDTNGYNTAHLQTIISNKLVDYVAMDIKAPLKEYAEVVGVEVDINNILTSINLVKASKVDYEFRTTVWADYFKKYDVYELFKPLKNAEQYYFHNFFNPNNYLSSFFKAATRKEITPILDIAQSFVKEVKLRGDWY